MGLEKVLADTLALLDTDRPAFFEKYIEARRRTRTPLAEALDIEGNKELVRYCWQTRWSKEVTMPEAVTTKMALSLIGILPYQALGAHPDVAASLMRHCILNYGFFDLEKMRLYLERERQPGERAIANVFFNAHDESIQENNRVRDNAVKLVRHTWEQVWKSDIKNIPEFVKSEDVRLIAEIYHVIKCKINSPSSLLRECIEDYGIFDDQKVRVYLGRTDSRERMTLYKAFFRSDEMENNIVRLLGYCWDNVWKSKLNIPEEITGKILTETAGPTLARDLGIAKLKDIIAKTINDYGILDGQKCEVLQRKEEHSHEDRQNGGRRRKVEDLIDIFFGEDNEYRTQNAELFLEQYQIRNGKRRSDLDANDYENIPAVVRQILDIEDFTQLQKSTKPDKSQDTNSYNVVQICWDDRLEQRLRKLLAQAEDQEAFLQDNPRAIWDTLGVTSFAAQMKAQELGIIPKTIEFGEGPANRLPTYPLIEFEGYEFGSYALAISGNIENCGRVDTHLYTPVHRQNLHVNVPIRFKRRKEEYSSKETRILGTIAAYLDDPNQFRKEVKEVRGSETIWQYHTPGEIEVTPRIVPVRIGPELMTQVFLPARYCADRGGIQTGVLCTGSEEIYLFRQSQPGKISEFSL